MNYLYLTIAVFLIAIQFSFSKLFQLKAGNTLKISLYFSFFSGTFSAIFFFCLGGFSIEKISLFSLMMAFLIGLVYFFSSIIGIKAYSLGNMSLYTMFMMLGLLVLPFFYGLLLLNENISGFKIGALSLLIIALCLPGLQKNAKKNSRTFYLLCLLIFILNGLCGIFSKAHQINNEAINVFDFCFLLQAFSALFSSLTLIILHFREKRKRGSTTEEITLPDTGMMALFRKKTIFLILGFSLISGTGYYLQLLCAVTMPATIMYPIITGGTVALTAVTGAVIFKEKPNFWTLASIILAFIATILFAF